MRDSDRQAFDVQLEALFGAFPEIPLTSQRRAAYWRALASMSIEVFTRCVDRAIGPKGDEELPNVARIWEISQELRTSGPSADPERPSVQYLLACYLLKQSRVPQAQLAQSWTYLQLGGQITGVVVPAADGNAAIRVMVIDLDLDAIWRQEQFDRASVLERAANSINPQLALPALNTAGSP